VFIPLKDRTEEPCRPQGEDLVVTPRKHSPECESGGPGKEWPEKGGLMGKYGDSGWRFTAGWGGQVNKVGHVAR
jgi:hypothetical protein